MKRTAKEPDATGPRSPNLLSGHSHTATTPDTPESAASHTSSGLDVYSFVTYDRQHGRILLHKYVCGHCRTTVMGWVVASAAPHWPRQWLLCPDCGKGSVLNDGIILPPPQTFHDVGGLPDGIAGLYDEARASFGAQAYTGCDMLCRKILMNAAVDKDAEKNQRFAYYVDYLDSNGYVTSPLKEMATAIKDNGNDAVHEIDPSNKKRAEHTLKFTRRILDTIYGTEHDLGEHGGARAGRTGAAK